MSDLTNNIVSAVIKITFITMLVLGTFFGIEGAENLSMVMAWTYGLLFSGFLLFLVAMPDDEEKKMIQEWNPKISMLAAISLHLCALVIMIWHGWIITSVVYSSNVFFLVILYELKNKYQKEAVGGNHEQ